MNEDRKNILKHCAMFRKIRFKKDIIFSINRPEKRIFPHKRMLKVKGRASYINRGLTSFRPLLC